MENDTAVDKTAETQEHLYLLNSRKRWYNNGYCIGINLQSQKAEMRKRVGSLLKPYRKLAAYVLNWRKK